MSRIICPNCGTSQPKKRNRHCISCGEELNFNDIERSEMVDSIFHFHPTPFTRAVTIASVIVAAINFSAIIAIFIIGNHNIIPMLILTIAALYNLWSCLCPHAAYKLHMLSSRHGASWTIYNSSDIDDPYHKEIIHVVYVRAAIYLAVSLLTTILYFVKLELFAL